MMTSCRAEILRKTAEHGAAATNIEGRCFHAQVVHEAESSSKLIPAALLLFNLKLALEGVLATLPKGSLNNASEAKIHSRATAAENEGVPLLVRVGDTSGSNAVSDGPRFNRTIVGGWAHVKCDGLEGRGAARNNRKSRSRKFLQYKVNERPCLALVLVQPGRSEVQVSVWRSRIDLSRGM